MSEEDRIRLMDRFAAAWNRHDCDALISMMTDDGVFEAAGGPEEFGARHTGHADLRTAFSAVWQTFPDASWNDARHTAAGDDRGFSEWLFRGTDRDGVKVEVHGVDLFIFRDGKIAKKNSFRKNRVK
jgi:steroid delta-isomerase-like uncharacterized protein